MPPLRGTPAPRASQRSPRFLLAPALTGIFLLKLILGFKVFDLVYILTAGGPGYDTSVASYRIWRTLFQEYNVGLAAAETVLLAVLVTGGHAAGDHLAPPGDGGHGPVNGPSRAPGWRGTGSEPGHGRSRVQRPPLAGSYRLPLRHRLPGLAAALGAWSVRVVFGIFLLLPIAYLVVLSFKTPDQRWLIRGLATGANQ